MPKAKAKAFYTGQRVTVKIGGRDITGEYIEPIGANSFGFLPDGGQGFLGQVTKKVKNIDVSVDRWQLDHA